jgi:hypothetical protein
MLARSVATSWKTAHRFRVARIDPADGCREQALGRPAAPRRINQAAITVSERTVSRYLQRDRLTAPRQSCRTFLANHICQLTLISPVTPRCVPHADDVIDVSGLAFWEPPSWNDESFAAQPCVVVDLRASLQRTSCGTRTVQDGGEVMAIRNGTGRGPPTSSDRLPERAGLPAASLPLHWTSATTDCVRRLAAGTTPAIFFNAV